MPPIRSRSIAVLLVLMAGCHDPFGLSLAGDREATFVSDSLPSYVDPTELTGPVVEAEPAVEVDGLIYQSAVVPTDTALDDGPMGLRVEVRVTNPGEAPVELPVQGCTVRPALYADPGLEEPLWSWGDHLECYQAPYSVTIPAAGTHTFHFHIRDVLLARAVPDGRYYVRARFMGVDGTLSFVAGSGDVHFRVPGLAFNVHVEESWGELRARVSVENRNAGPVYLEWGSCALVFYLFREPDLSDEPGTLERDRNCLSYLAYTELAPGRTLHPDELDYGTADGAIEPGTYYLGVAVHMNLRQYVLPMGPIRVR